MTAINPTERDWLQICSQDCDCIAGQSALKHAPVTFRHPKHDIFIPDHTDPWTSLRRVTHLGIVSHQDDLEIAAYHGITECFHSGDKWFGGVVVTDGAGSPRKGPYADYTDEEMQAVRKMEQQKAAFVGEYSFMAQLGYPSEDVKTQRQGPVVEDLKFILEHSQPQVLYVHNPCDRHDTHVATFLRCLEAIRALPLEMRPKKVYGCEVWRKLDWLLHEDKTMLWVDKYPHLLRPLLGVFDSQISGGKRYDLAEEGLRHANATYFDSHTTDNTSLLTFAMDLTPLVENDQLDVQEYTLGYVRRLEADVAQRMKKFI
ncbi:GlcNAc-PI de-N-acetylase [Prosthecobacter debontii]|uniref:GlcNAc-PI de-N-acetylase n=1 Tax=Prosthecobacter debontii TaxID=48467 RepID=A0A1T4YZ96_9BACT|nr:PIG-L family deacetylase [Prosthecobacter debontii]SKB07094.1 GlcNAc-PI de-N-acetylase [Prosthecobacter debontii]